jgi:hypothetical protein
MTSRIENLHFPRVISPELWQVKSCLPGFPIILGSSLKWDHFLPILWKLHRPYCSNIPFENVTFVYFFTPNSMEWWRMYYFIILVRKNLYWKVTGKPRTEKFDAPRLRRNQTSEPWTWPTKSRWFDMVRLSSSAVSEFVRFTWFLDQGKRCYSSYY